MKKEKKYIIELNERQARLLSYACDQFSRLIQGQDDEQYKEVLRRFNAIKEEEK